MIVTAFLYQLTQVQLFSSHCIKSLLVNTEFLKPYNCSHFHMII